MSNPITGGDFVPKSFNIVLNPLLDNGLLTLPEPVFNRFPVVSQRQIEIFFDLARRTRRRLVHGRGTAREGNEANTNSTWRFDFSLAASLLATEYRILWGILESPNPIPEDPSSDGQHSRKSP
jgi:hypothetical protein